MTPFLHLLHTGTLAAWLSAGALATVGLVMPQWVGRPQVPDAPVTQVIWVEPELHPAPEPAPAAPAAGETAPDMVPDAVPDPLPAPPEMPELAELPPLPEIPDLPPEPPRASPGPAAAPPATRPRAAAANRPTGTARPSAPGGTGGAARSDGGGEMGQASRIAAGRMPGPAYPAESRRKGQSGTVVVEFTVSNNGRVIAARAVSPSPWPLLNEAAVRAVRTWRFPPGAVMTLRRPIAFQLR